MTNPITACLCGLTIRLVAILALAGQTSLSNAAPASGRPVFRSPIDVAFSPDGRLLAAADPTWGGVVMVDPVQRTVVFETGLKGNPAHVIWNGLNALLVSEGSAGTVAEIDAKSGTLLRRLTAVRRATGLALTHDRTVLLVCDRGLNQVAFIDMASGQVTRAIDVVREPDFIMLTGDDAYAIVGNKLPRSEDARLAAHGAEVSIIEVATGVVRNVRLPGGSSIVRQIAVSPDNRWAYVIHQAGRANTMVTQLDRGWVMTNCTSVIDIASATLYTTFLFDRDGMGAANPWGVAVSPDGSKLWATLAGISELASVDLLKLHSLLEADPALRSRLHADLAIMTGEGLLSRRSLSDVEGTRGLSLSPDGSTLAVASYFEGKILLVDLANEQTYAVPLANIPAEDAIRKGERLFNGGKNCYQRWLSCATCHEGGRMDGLNWDLLNDGQGNPKNTRSHVLSALTPPTNATGCRESALVSARAGYKNIEFQEASEKDIVEPTYAYIQSIAAEPSPFLGADGRLTADAVEGKRIFDSADAGCAECHKPPLFTNMRRYDVGTRLPAPLGPDISTWDDGGYDVPSLVELWRTGPYLHLGNATTVKDVLTTFNKNDRHGKTSHLSPGQIDQLVSYLVQIGPTDEVAGTEADGGVEIIPMDASATVIPTDTTPHDKPAGNSCICRVEAGRSTGFGNRIPVVAFALLAFFGWRRRRKKSRASQKRQFSRE